MKTKKFIRSNPHLPVSDLKKTIDYYRDTLGFYDEWTWTDKDGELTDGGIRRDDMRLLFGEDSDFENVVNCYDKSGLLLMWFVNDIDSVFSEFQSREIQFVDTLKKRPHGLREFSFIDINGYLIRVAEGMEQLVL